MDADTKAKLAGVLAAAPPHHRHGPLQRRQRDLRLQDHGVGRSGAEGRHGCGLGHHPEPARPVQRRLQRRQGGHGHAPVQLGRHQPQHRGHRRLHPGQGRWLRGHRAPATAPRPASPRSASSQVLRTTAPASPGRAPRLHRPAIRPRRRRVRRPSPATPSPGPRPADRRRPGAPSPPAQLERRSTTAPTPTGPRSSSRERPHPRRSSPRPAPAPCSFCLGRHRRRHPGLRASVRRQRHPAAERGRSTPCCNDPRRDLPLLHRPVHRPEIPLPRLHRTPACTAERQRHRMLTRPRARTSSAATLRRHRASSSRSTASRPPQARAWPP